MLSMKEDELSHKNQKSGGKGGKGARVLPPGKQEAGSSSGFTFFSTPLLTRFSFSSLQLIIPSSLRHTTLLPTTYPSASTTPPITFQQKTHKKKNAHTLTRQPPIQKGKKTKRMRKKRALGLVHTTNSADILAACHCLQKSAKKRREVKSLSPEGNTKNKGVNRSPDPVLVFYNYFFHIIILHTQQPTRDHKSTKGAKYTLNKL